MKSPLENRRVLIVDEVNSTQELASKVLLTDPNVGAVLAHEQLKGRGRFNRNWHSASGSSLTCSLLLADYPDWDSFHLLGMSVAVAAAGVLHCQLQWPNDIVFGGKKLGGVLTEIYFGNRGQKIAVIGVGINLTENAFPPELADQATSLYQAHGRKVDAEGLLLEICDRLVLLEEPNTWANIEPAWEVFDTTPGKIYKLANGEKATAIGIGSDAQLIASLKGESIAVFAADAILGGQLNDDSRIEGT